MAKKSSQIIINLTCSVCRRPNYTTTINRTTRQQKGGKVVKLELKKYCRWCKTHTLHQEEKIKKAKK